MAKQQLFTVTVSKKYNKETRHAIAQEIIDFIIKRTKNKNVDKDGKPFPKYSKGYTKSLDFKIAGKRPSKIDLSLTEEMLFSMKHLKGMDQDGKISIGYDGKDLKLNGKVEGNRIGSYGKPSGNPKKARDFLGISEKDLDKILKKFPKDDKKELLKRIQRATQLERAARERVEGTERVREKIEDAKEDQ